MKPTETRPTVARRPSHQRADQTEETVEQNYHERKPTLHVLQGLLLVRIEVCHPCKVVQLVRRQKFLLKRPPIPFFSNIPPKVDDDSIYSSSLCFFKFGATLAPIAMSWADHVHWIKHCQVEPTSESRPILLRVWVVFTKMVRRFRFTAAQLADGVTWPVAFCQVVGGEYFLMH